MVCDRCQNNDAVTHITQTLRGVTIKRHYCQSCAADLGLTGRPDDSLLLFPWEEQGAHSFSVAGKISRIEPEVIILLVTRSSHYKPGSELSIHAKYIPAGMQCVGAEFGFNFPEDMVSSVLLDVPHNTMAAKRPLIKADMLPPERATPSEPVQERATDTFSRLKSYVSRMADKEDASIVISTVDRKHAILLLRKCGQTFLSISADLTRGDGQERRMLDFFQGLRMAPVRDRTSSNSGIPNATRTLHYLLPENRDVISELCISVLSDVFGITAADELRFLANGL